MSTPSTHKVTQASTAKKSAAKNTADKPKPKNAVAAARATTAKAAATAKDTTTKAATTAKATTIKAATTAKDTTAKAATTAQQAVNSVAPRTVPFTSIELPKVELPKVELPKVEIPKVEVPREMPAKVADVIESVQEGVVSAPATAKKAWAQVADLTRDAREQVQDLTHDARDRAVRLGRDAKSTASHTVVLVREAVGILGQVLDLLARVAREVGDLGPGLLRGRRSRDDALLHRLDHIGDLGRHLTGNLDLRNLDLRKLDLRELDLGQLDRGEGHGARCDRVHRLLSGGRGLGRRVLRRGRGLDGGRLRRGRGLGGRVLSGCGRLRGGRARSGYGVLRLGLVGGVLGGRLLGGACLGDLVGRRRAHELSSRDSRGVSPARFSAWKAR